MNDFLDRLSPFETAAFIVAVVLVLAAVVYAEAQWLGLGWFAYVIAPIALAVGAGLVWRDRRRYLRQRTARRPDDSGR